MRSISTCAEFALFRAKNQFKAASLRSPHVLPMRRLADVFDVMNSRYFVNLAALHSSCSIGAPHATKPSLRLKQTWSTSVKTSLHPFASRSFPSANTETDWQTRCVIAYRWTFSEDGAHDGLLCHRQRPARPLLCYNLERCLREIDRDQPVLSLSLSFPRPFAPCPWLKARSRTASVWIVLLTLS